MLPFVFFSGQKSKGLSKRVSVCLPWKCLLEDCVLVGHWVDWVLLGELCWTVSTHITRVTLTSPYHLPSLPINTGGNFTKLATRWKMSLRVFLVILFIICQYYYQCCVQRRIQDTTSHLGYHSHNIESEHTSKTINGNIWKMGSNIWSWQVYPKHAKHDALWVLTARCEVWWKFAWKILSRVGGGGGGGHYCDCDCDTSHHVTTWQTWIFHTTPLINTASRASRI